MHQAKDLMNENLEKVDHRLSAPETIKALLDSAEQILAVYEGTKYKGLITAVSIVSLLGREKNLAMKNAGDLMLDSSPSVSSDAALSSILPLLSKSRVLLVVNSQGKPEGFITGALLAEKLAGMAKEIEQELDAVINFSSDEILVADQQGKVLRANYVFEENFGVKLSSVLGKTVDDLEKKKIFFPSVTKLVLDKREAQTVIQSRRDGRKLLATGTPVFNKDGSIFRVVVNTRDITRLNNLKNQFEEAELLKNRYQQELVELRQGYLGRGNLVAESPVMVDLISIVRKIAAVDSTVLLTGESGVGKGMIARYIHNYSPRSNKPFTVVNCGAIPENLLESELFGYAGGAFTGALREGKIGKLELANEGTLFLDEIADLPVNLQVKLLHVIQEGVISRIGGTKEIKLNLRFIAATNRDIARLVEEGEFREDLYFRLDVIPLMVPPLRERQGDIKILVEQFLDKLNRQYQKQKYFSAEAMKYLESYQWPGNVRELENLIERMMIVVDHDEIGPDRLPNHLLGSSRNRISRSGTEIISGSHDLPPLKSALRDLEIDILREALKRYRTTYKMAEILKIDQSTVVRKLNKYKLITEERDPDPQS
jgi:PAS domain S-box-containing protein